jgi:hypothetical protein
LSVMVRQNFAATAAYFERRASKASTVGLRQQFESAAARYRSMAEIHKHRRALEHCTKPLVVAVPPRRQRLIELFHAGNNDSTELFACGHEEHARSKASSKKAASVSTTPG